MPLITHIIAVVIAASDAPVEKYTSRLETITTAQPQTKKYDFSHCGMFDDQCQIREIESHETLWDRFRATWIGGTP